MPRGVSLIQIAKERCANWNDPTGQCFGWSVTALLNQGRGPVTSADHCKLKDGQPCAYFERCVIPGIPKKERADFHYGLELEKLAILAQRNQQLERPKTAFASPDIKKVDTPKKSLKTKDYVKSRMRHNGGPCTC